MCLQGIRLVTFDATNTLLKFKMVPSQYYTKIARTYGYRGSESDAQNKMRENFKMMWEQHPNFGRNSILWEEWWRQVVKLTLQDHLPEGADTRSLGNTLINDFKTSKCWDVAAGSDTLLQIIKKKGIAIGVISNSDPRLYDILQNLGLSKYFDFILTSYDCGFSKPDSRIFQEALLRCKEITKASESLHIGDDLEKDYIGARESGWHALLISNNETKIPPAKDHVFANIDLLSIAISQNKLKLV